MNIEKYGKKIDNVNVKINYQIIELFSAGLYSSANKAFEELICNSYDAFASKVYIYLPLDLVETKDPIVIFDNGEGMNSQELKSLWEIGRSNKRKDSERDKKRLQIGSFGIGKLSTYILAKKLTYLSRKENRYLYVTMDYDKIKENVDNLVLDEKEVTKDEAEKILSPYLKKHGVDIIKESPFGEDLKTWTCAFMYDFRPKAHEIQYGRLKWILKTALPLNPGFSLYINGEQIAASKQDTPIMKMWTIGDCDETVKKWNLGDEKEIEGKHFIDLPHLKNISGHFVLYEDSLLGGKSETLGRSNGIFLFVRGRLINLDDGLLGMEAFSHGVFNRLQCFVYADELDQYIASTRESIKECTAYKELKDYLKKKIANEIVSYYYKEEEKSSKSRTLGFRLQQTPQSLIGKPIYTFVNKFFAGNINQPIYFELPEESNKEKLLLMYKDITDEKEIVKDIEWSMLNPSDPMVKFNLLTQKLEINQAHPFVLNSLENAKNKNFIEYIATSEFLTEANLYEIGIDEEQVRSIIFRRDNILRGLVLSGNVGIPLSVHMLQNCLSNPNGLEEAACVAFNSIGFSCRRIGGPGKPDGIAFANIAPKGNVENYSLTYDTKSTSKDKIDAITANMAGIDRHRKDNGANYCVVFSRGFAGENDDESAIAKEAKNLKINVIKIKDFIKLLVYLPIKRYNLKDLKSLFENSFTPKQTEEWIDKFISKENQDRVSYECLIDTILYLQETDTEYPTVSVVRREINLREKKSYSIEEIRDALKTLRGIAPNYIFIDSNDKCNIATSKEVFLKSINHSIDNFIPLEYKKIYETVI